MKTLNSKLTVFTAAVLMGGSLTGWAAIDFTATGGGAYDANPGILSTVIPDNNLSGVAYPLNFADTGLTINPGSVQVTLDISGGYNGDLTAYLSHGSQVSYLLMANQATGGSGYDNVTFGTGSTFDNMDPSGSWTLFFADTSPGDTSTLIGFDVTLGTITAVPEPTTVTLAALGVILVSLGRIRWHRRNAKPATV
jgi:subtilisin-like proprotein convertase family protein